MDHNSVFSSNVWLCEVDNGTKISLTCVLMGISGIILELWRRPDTRSKTRSVQICIDGHQTRHGLIDRIGQTLKWSPTGQGWENNCKSDPKRSSSKSVSKSALKSLARSNLESFSVKVNDRGVNLWECDVFVDTRQQKVCVSGRPQDFLTS